MYGCKLLNSETSKWTRGGLTCEPHENDLELFELLLACMGGRHTHEHTQTHKSAIVDWLWVEVGGVRRWCYDRRHSCQAMVVVELWARAATDLS